MKSPRYNVSFPSDVQKDLAAESFKEGISASEFIRRSTVECLARLTKKAYSSIAWGGARRRAGAGRKPEQSDAFRSTVAADGAPQKATPRSRAAASSAAAGTKKRRSSAA